MGRGIEILSLDQAGVSLIDCVHKTPIAQESGELYIAIPQLKDGRVETADARRISIEDFEEWTKKALPQAYDVVLSRRCNPGETAHVAPGLSFAVGQNLVLLRSDGSRVFPPFLRWLVRTPQWWEQVSKFMNVGAVFSSLKCADVPKFELPIPSLPEQQRLAQMLGALDDKIELNRRMNRTLESMAQAIFKSWFVNFEPVKAKAAAKAAGASSAAIERAAMAAIAGRSIEEAIAQEGYFDDLTPSNRESLAQTAALFPDAFQESELGEIPEGWSAAFLGDMCDRIFSGGTPRTKTAEFWDGEIPWLSSGETGARFITATEKCITERGVQSSSAREARGGSTVIASAGQGKTRGQTSFLGFDSYINQSVIALEVDKEKITDSYLFFNLAPRYEQLRQISDAHSSRGSLTTKLLAGIQTVVPDRALIREFDNIASPMIQRILSNDRESRTLANLRDSLLPKLLNGEIRPE